MSADKSTIEAELHSMGASQPSLWIALFEVNEAIHSSQPLPKMPEWNYVCSTVQDLYRLSLKDPREFAVAQTLTTIMHQHQAKEEILNRVSAMHRGPNNSPEACVPKESPQLSEIQNQLDALSGKVEELDKAVEDLKFTIEISTKSVSNAPTEPFIIPQVAITEINRYLNSTICGGHPNAEQLSSILGLQSEWVLQEFEKAKKISTPEVPATIIFVLHMMLKNGEIFKFKYSKTSQIARVTKLVRTAYRDTFPFPRSNVYDDIRRALEASSIIKRVL